MSSPAHEKKIGGLIIVKYAVNHKGITITESPPTITMKDPSQQRVGMQQTCKCTRSEERKKRASLDTPLSPYLRARITVIDLLDAGATNFLELACQRVRLVELLHLVAASYALADEEHVRHGSPARHMCEEFLEFGAQWVEV